MRILVLVHEYPPVGGGGGQAAKSICQGLARKGHEVLVLTAHLQGLPREDFIEGVRVKRLPSARRLPFKAGLTALVGFLISGLMAGVSHARLWKPNLIHVHFAVPAGPVAWILKRIYKIPYVLTVHLGDVPGGVPEKTGAWFRWVYPFTPIVWREASRVIAVSDYTRQLALKHYPVQIQVIPNGIDMPQSFHNAIQIGTPPRIAFAGRFVPQKNPLTVVEILAELKDLPWKCIMLGDGPLREDVESEIKRRGMEDRFELTGWVLPDDVIAQFGRSDILFMPSISEGLPVVGLQALTMGLAIVASQVGGFIDLVTQGENGYLLKNDDVRGFTQALRVLLSDSNRLHEFKEASKEKARRFDLGRIVDEYIRIFQEIAIE